MECVKCFFYCKKWALLHTGYHWHTIFTSCVYWWMFFLYLLIGFWKDIHINFLWLLWHAGVFVVYSGVFWCFLVYSGVIWCIMMYSGLYLELMVFTCLFWCILVYFGVLWCLLVGSTPLSLSRMPSSRRQETWPPARQRNEYLLNKQYFSKIKRNWFFLLFCTMKYYIQKLLEVCWEKYKYIFPEIFHSIINLLYRFKFAK